MATEARCGSTLVAAVLIETLIKEGVSKGSRFWEAINAITNFQLDPAVDVDVVYEIVLVDEVLGDVAQFDAEIVRPV